MATTPSILAMSSARLVHRAHRIGAGDDVRGDQQRRVVAGTELLRDQVVRVPLRRPLLRAAVVREGQGEIFHRVRQHADDEHHQDHGERRHLGGDAPPSEHPWSSWRRGGRAERASPRATGLGPQLLAEQRENRGQQGHAPHQTAIATPADAAMPITVRNGMFATASPQSAMITVVPANTTAEPAVAERLRDRLVDGQALRHQPAIARDQEQAVVDPDGQADHLGQGGRGRGDGGHRGDDKNSGQRDADPQTGGQQRQAGGEQRDERDGQHHEGDRETPISSVALIAVPVLVYMEPPSETVKSSSVGGAAAFSTSATVSAGRSVSDTSNWIWDRANALVGRDGADRARGERIVDAGHVLDLLDRLDPLLDRGLLIGYRTLGAGENDLTSGTGRLREPLGEGVDALLGLGTRNREVVDQLPADCRPGQPEHDRGKEEPGDEDAQLVPRDGAPETIQKSGHFATPSRRARGCLGSRTAATQSVPADACPTVR